MLLSDHPGKNILVSGVHGPLWQWYEGYKHIGGKLPIYPAPVDAALKKNGLDCKKATAAEIDTLENSSTEWQMAMGLILGSDHLPFAKLFEELDNQHSGHEVFSSEIVWCIHIFEYMDK